MDGSGNYSLSTYTSRRKKSEKVCIFYGEQFNSLVNKEKNVERISRTRSTYLRNGRLPGVKPRYAWRIWKSDLDRFINGVTK